LTHWLLVVGCQAFLARPDFLRDLLALFLREDVAGFHGRRLGGGGRQMLPMRSSQLRAAVEQNTAMCIANFQKVGTLRDPLMAIKSAWQTFLGLGAHELWQAEAGCLGFMACALYCVW
jgi:hypothetical protein